MDTVKTVRQANGRWGPGNQSAALAKGVRAGMGKKTIRKTVAETAHRELVEESKRQLMVSHGLILEKHKEHHAAIHQKTFELALGGDLNAIKYIGRLIGLEQERTYIEGAEDLVDVPLEHRAAAIADALASGQISIETYRALADSTQKAIELSVIAPLKMAVQMIKSGKNIDQALAKLAEAIDFIDVSNESTDHNLKKVAPNSGK